MLGQSNVRYISKPGHEEANSDEQSRSHRRAIGRGVAAYVGRHRDAAPSSLTVPVLKRRCNSAECSRVLTYFLPMG